MLWTRPRSSRPRASDRHLAATIKVQLETHEDVKISEPYVRVKAGVVLLQGRVPTVNQKGLATSVAASVRGVRGVFNELRVGDSRTEGAKADPKGSGADRARAHVV